MTFAKLKTIVLTAAAVIYVTGEKVGEYYYANKESIHADLLAFYQAVVAGTKQAYAATYQLGADARVAYEDARVAYEAADLSFVNAGLARHHRAFESVQRGLYARLGQL